MASPLDDEAARPSPGPAHPDVAGLLAAAGIGPGRAAALPGNAWRLAAGDGYEIVFRPSGGDAGTWDYSVSGPAGPASGPRTPLGEWPAVSAGELTDVLACALTPGEFRAAALRAGAARASADLQPHAPYAMVSGVLADGRAFTVSPQVTGEHPEPGQPMPPLVELTVFAPSMGGPGGAFAEPDFLDPESTPAGALRLIAGGRSPFPEAGLPPEAAGAAVLPGAAVQAARDYGLVLERRSPDPPPLDFTHPWADGVPWYYRVAVSDRQAVVGFPKFSTVGIGFEDEPGSLDLNLGYDRGTETIFRHVYSNKGDAAIADDACRQAISMVRDAAARDIRGASAGPVVRRPARGPRKAGPFARPPRHGPGA
jgi:hypothetical protein